MTMYETILMLARRGVITMDPDEEGNCCSIPRDEDGFCQERNNHPIYVAAPCKESWFDERYPGGMICERHGFWWDNDLPVCNAILNAD